MDIFRVSDVADPDISKDVTFSSKTSQQQLDGLAQHSRHSRSPDNTSEHTFHISRLLRSKPVRCFSLVYNQIPANTDYSPNRSRSTLKSCLSLLWSLFFPFHFYTVLTLICIIFKLCEPCNPPRWTSSLNHLSKAEHIQRLWNRSVNTQTQRDNAAEWMWCKRQLQDDKRSYPSGGGVIWVPRDSCRCVCGRGRERERERKVKAGRRCVSSGIKRLSHAMLTASRRGRSGGSIKEVLPFR